MALQIFGQEGVTDHNYLRVNADGSIDVFIVGQEEPVNAYINGVDYVAGQSGIDASTETLQQISYEHHEIHSGSHYYIEDVAEIAINNVFDVQWVTPDTAKWTHFNFLLNCESETEWYIYEGAAINVTGTVLAPVNNNRNSSNTSVNLVASIANGSIADANADTAVAGATAIAHGIVGAGKEGGVISRDREIVLKQNTVYCMRAIATTAGYTNFLMEWYEHESKN